MSNRKRATHQKNRTDMWFTESDQLPAEFAADAYQDVFMVGAALGAENVRFWCKRLEEDLSLGAKLIRCSTIGAALEAQTSFFQSMAIDYSCQPRKFIELIAPRARVPKALARRNSGAKKAA